MRVRLWRERFRSPEQAFHFVERRLNRALWLKATALAENPAEKPHEPEPNVEGVTMEIITVNVGQGALAIVRDQDEAIIVDSRIPPAGDSSVA